MKKREQGKILTMSEREELTSSIRRDEDFRDMVKKGDLAPGQMGPMQSAEGSVDIGAIERSIAHKKAVLAAGTPQALTGPERAAAEARRKVLAEQLGERLLTHKEMDLMPKHGYEYHRAVRKSTAQEVGNPETQAMMSEYRNLSAQLDPDNPEAQSIEALRKNT